ncbi:hypothetical protein [Tunturiibacter gelidiferens]|uniref:hypothetical protein n=1 Tax=Tunturiibacter gelidiferens TaxID=3069689 RepID=UPI003D9BDA9D
MASDDALSKAFASAELSRQQSRFKFSDQGAFDRHQSAIDSLDPEIREIALVMGYPVPVNCVAGVFPLPEINAVAMALPNQAGYIIGVNEGLFHFVEGMAQICALYFPFSDDPMADLSKDQRGCTLFVELLSSLAAFTVTVPFQNAVMMYERTQLAETISILMTFYVASHEYAHVMLGHHARLGHSSRKTTSGGRIECDEIPLSQQLEFDADFRGFMTTFAFADQMGGNRALALWAADFYFAAISFWEAFSEEVEPIRASSKRLCLATGARCQMADF